MTVAPPQEGEQRERIDPRLRARRVAVVREAGRRRLRLLLFVIACFALFGLAGLIVESPLLDVDHITVAGAGRVPASEIVAASGIQRGEALAFVDTGRARDRVEALPRIASVKVTRSFPGTVHIAVTEREPAAWARVPTRSGAPEGPVVFLDVHGRVIERGPKPLAGLPEIRGLGRLPAVGDQVHPVGAVTLLAALPPGLRLLVTDVSVDHGEATLGLRPPVGGWPSAQEVRLGTIDDVHAKGLAAVAVLGALDKNVGYLDVTVPEAPATGG